MSSDNAGKTFSPKTVNGMTVAIDVSNGVKIGDAKVVKADVTASNGDIQIDRVLIPAE